MDDEPAPLAVHQSLPQERSSGTAVYTSFNLVIAPQLAGDRTRRFRHAAQVSRLGRAPIAPELIRIVDLLRLVGRTSPPAVHPGAADTGDGRPVGTHRGDAAPAGSRPSVTATSVAVDEDAPTGDAVAP